MFNSSLSLDYMSDIVLCHTLHGIVCLHFFLHGIRGSNMVFLITSPRNIKYCKFGAELLSQFSYAMPLDQSELNICTRGAFS